jgi:DNA-binding transcriptional LysR family regulator
MMSRVALELLHASRILSDLLWRRRRVGPNGRGWRFERVPHNFLLRVDSSGLGIGILALHAIRAAQAMHTGASLGVHGFRGTHFQDAHTRTWLVWCRQYHGRNLGTISIMGSTWLFI